jgi:transcriptional regulator with XRE-family HTH domain
MSVENLANYLEQRITLLGISKSEAARRAGISRQTWYRLLSADMTDVKLSTIIRLAEALETSPLHLLRLYFGETSADEASRLHPLANDYCGAQA